MHFSVMDVLFHILYPISYSVSQFHILYTCKISTATG